MASFLASLQTSLQSPLIPYQPLALGLIVLVAVFESYIGSRQSKYLSPILSPHIPASLLPYLVDHKSSLVTYHKSQLYAKAKMSYGSVTGILDLLESFILFSSISFGIWSFLGLQGGESEGFPFVGTNSKWSLLKGFWDLSASGYGGEITQSLIFVVLLTSIGTVLSAPKSYYSNFVLEENHGFNKSTVNTWVIDQIKSYFLSIALEVPIITGILYIIHYVGPQGILTLITGLMTFILTFQLIMIPLYPLIILPLFNTLTPLKIDHPVYPKVQDLATKLSFPLNKIWVIDGSKRSAHSNAFFYGVPFLSKNIVIYDTLLEKSTPEEIEAILAHELGHWSGNHILILLATSLFQTAFSLTVFVIFLNNFALLSAFGFHQSSPTIISLLLAANLFTPISAVMHFLTNTVTRALEYNADNFAVKLGSSYATNLKGALVKIHEQNLAIYGVDPIYSGYHNNHPTLIERLESLDEGLKSQESKKNL